MSWRVKPQPCSRVQGGDEKPPSLAAKPASPAAIPLLVAPVPGTRVPGGTRAAPARRADRAARSRLCRRSREEQ